VPTPSPGICKPRCGCTKWQYIYSSHHGRAWHCSNAAAWHLHSWVGMVGCRFPGSFSASTTQTNVSIFGHGSNYWLLCNLPPSLYQLHAMEHMARCCSVISSILNVCRSIRLCSRAVTVCRAAGTDSTIVGRPSEQRWHERAGPARLARPNSRAQARINPAVTQT